MLRLVKSVFSPLVKTVAKAAKSNTGKVLGNALMYQSWEGGRIVLCSLSTYMIDVSKRFMIDVVIEFLRAYGIYE